MNQRILELARQAGFDAELMQHNHDRGNVSIAETFAELIVKDCIEKIESYKVSVGNSTAGEMACRWTLDALRSIRDDILEEFGIEDKS